MATVTVSIGKLATKATKSSTLEYPYPNFIRFVIKHITSWGVLGDRMITITSLVPKFQNFSFLVVKTKSEKLIRETAFDNSLLSLFELYGNFSLMPIPSKGLLYLSERPCVYQPIRGCAPSINLKMGLKYFNTLWSSFSSTWQIFSLNEQEKDDLDVIISQRVFKDTVRV